MIRWGIRILVALVVIVVAAYFLIPGDRLGKSLLTRLSAGSSSAVYSCDSARVGFPPAVVFDRFRIDFRKRPSAAVEADTLAVRPRLLALLTGRMAFKVLSDAYGGKLDGDIDYIRHLTTRGPMDATFRVTDLDLEKCAYLRMLAGVPLAGRLKGTIEFSGETMAFAQGSGRAQLTVRGCRFPMVGNFGRMVGPVHFDTLELRTVFDRGILQVEQLILSGRGIRSVLRGHVVVKKEFRDSILSLSGKLEVTGLSGLTFKFAITGPIAHPALTVI